MPPTSRIILALDETPARVREVLDTLVPLGLSRVKIGHQLLAQTDTAFLKELSSVYNLKLFFDIKLHDTEDTMVRALQFYIQEYAPEFITIHLSAGTQALKKAVAACKDSPTTLLGVGILSSLTDEDSQSVYGEERIKAIQHLTNIGIKSGLSGFIVTSETLEVLKNVSCAKVAVGIRTEIDAQNNHIQALTPQKAIALGTDLLVIGRPLLKPKDKLVSAWENIVAEIAL